MRQVRGQKRLANAADRAGSQHGANPFDDRFFRQMRASRNFRKRRRHEAAQAVFRHRQDGGINGIADRSGHSGVEIHYRNGWFVSDSPNA